MLERIKNDFDFRSLVLHPFLLAMYVVLAPLAENVDIVSLQAIRTLLLAVFGVTAVSAIVRFLVKNDLRAGLVTSGVVLWFGTYGHLSELVTTQLNGSEWIDSLLLMLGVAALIGWAYWVLRRLSNPGLLTMYLNAVSALALAFPLWTILTYSQVSPQLDSNVERYREELPLTAAELIDMVKESPQADEDVYYLILDGYTRHDTLMELYGFDNSEFIEALRSRGFFVAEEGQANYSETAYSIASSLNMSYLTEAPEFMLEDIHQNQDAALKDGIARLVHQNTLASFFDRRGYEVIAFDTGYDRTAMHEIDHFASSPEVGRFNAGAAFELMLMDTTIGKAFLRLSGREFTPLQSLFDDHRARVVYGIGAMSTFADRPGPQFVFSHVISPHSPYVFGPQGEPRYGVDPFTLLGGPAIENWSPELYTDQVQYINSLVLKEIDEILAASDSEPIIILQADHSSRAWGVADPPPEIQQKLLYPIFLAMYLPDSPGAIEPHNSISPVNVFRVILNRFFGTNLEMLPDTRYFVAEQDGQLRFVEACGWIGGCGEASTAEGPP